MTEEQLYKRYNEIRSEDVEVRFVDGDTMTGKLDSFTSGAMSLMKHQYMLTNMNCMPVKSQKYEKFKT